MKIRPLIDHCVIEPLDPPEMLGGLHLTETQQDDLRQRAIGMLIEKGRKFDAFFTDQGEDPPEEHQIVLYWKNKAGVIQGLDAQHLVYCPAAALIGVVVDDKHATAAEIRAIKEKADKFHKEQIESMRASRLVTAAGMPPRLAE